MPRRSKKDASEMSFFDHLDELRGALWRLLVGVFVGAAVCYYFAPTLQDWLLIPFHEQTSSSLALLAPTEGFVVRLKISLVAGLLLTAPWSFFQVWAFVAPGLFSHERKMVLPVVFFSTLLFLIGAAFATYILPHATRFFLSFATVDVQNAWSLGKYVDFVLRLLLAFGVVFELPLLIYFLARFGVVTPGFLRQYRRHMIIGFLVLAALITPPDIFTQVILTLPMVVLYEASILLAVVARRTYERKHQEFMSDDKDDDSTVAGDPGDESVSTGMTAKPAPEDEATRAVPESSDEGNDDLYADPSPEAGFKADPDKETSESPTTDDDVDSDEDSEDESDTESREGR